MANSTPYLWLGLLASVVPASPENTRSDANDSVHKVKLACRWGTATVLRPTSAPFARTSGVTGSTGSPVTGSCVIVVPRDEGEDQFVAAGRDLEAIHTSGVGHRLPGRTARHMRFDRDAWQNAPGLISSCAGDPMCERGRRDDAQSRHDAKSPKPLRQWDAPTRIHSL